MSHPDAPQLEFVASGRIQVDVSRVVGAAGRTQRRVVPITGGTFEGPRLRAVVVGGGADWQIDDGEGVVAIEARYLIETQDGVTISVINRGLRRASPEITAKLAAREPVSPDAYYFRATPAFDAPPGPYAWMRESLFLSIGRREPDSVSLDVFRVL
jgi:hypothetical protein